jgi:predicted dehydrogenase
VELTGSEGTLILDDDHIVATDLRSKSQAATGASNISSRPCESASTPAVSDFRWHKALLEDFISAVRQNKAPVCDGHDGRRSLRVIEAIYRSAKDSNCTADV